MNSKERVLTVLKGGVPDRVPFAPNIGQWFSCHFLGDLTGHGKGYYDLADYLEKVEALVELMTDVEGSACDRS